MPSCTYHGFSVLDAGFWVFCEFTIPFGFENDLCLRLLIFIFLILVVLQYLPSRLLYIFCLYLWFIPWFWCLNQSSICTNFYVPSIGLLISWRLYILNSLYVSLCLYSLFFFLPYPALLISSPCLIVLYLFYFGSCCPLCVVSSSPVSLC